MANEWVNWSGSLRFTPQQRVAPAHESELAGLVRRAAAEGRTVRAVGHGHSSTALVQTEDLLVSLDRMSGLLHVDRETCTATLGAGTQLDEAGRLLREAGLAMEHLGDIDQQALAGVIATGTHGSGRKLHNLAAPVIGVRMISAAGELIEWNAEREPELLRAARVSLGAIGIQTALTLRLIPAYQLHKRVFCAHVEDALAHMHELADANRSVDFYWYPRRDDVKIRLLNMPGQQIPALPWATLLEEEQGWSAEIIPNRRELRFEELEYALPAEAAIDCFCAVRERIKERHRQSVAWRVLFRYVAADDAYLSTAHGRETVTISILQNATLPYWPYFLDIEPIFQQFGGRPHWGKHHTAGPAYLRRVYPEWERFQQIRRTLDPNGVFLNPYLSGLFGQAEEAHAAARQP
jgi:FAD/FMN-containing dehydrogenase